jgi:DNA-binding XRE family transcriptional regulator
VTLTTSASKSAICVQVTNGDKPQSPRESAPNVWYNEIGAAKMSEQPMSPFNQHCVAYRDLCPVDPVGVSNRVSPGMDPNYSTHTGLYPWDQPAPGSAESCPMTQASDFSSVRQPRDDQAAGFKKELQRRVEVMPSGQRIRNLRDALGWTQRVAAKELRVSLRTVIRHEKGPRRAPWLRLPLLVRLCQLEREHADQIIAYRDYLGPERA